MTRARDIADSTKTLSVDGGTIKLDGNYPTNTGNVALGNTALDSLGAGNYNTAVGHNALTANTDGSNTAFGAFSLAAVTTGGNNVAVGREALEANTGDNNTAVGYQAATSNATGFITAIGALAGKNYNTSGTDTFGSTFVGLNSGETTTTGVNNSALGGFSLRFNTTGSQNVALGATALYSNTSASNSTAVGCQALYSQTTASAGNNTAFGYRAGYSVTTGYWNLFAGDTAGFNTTGYRNTFLGHESGKDVTSGNKNSILGAYNGNQGGLDIRTSSNNIVLSDGDGNPKMYYDGALSSPMWVINNNTTAQWTTRIRHDATSDAYGLIITYNNATINANTNPFIYCNDSTTVRFIVNSNGNVTNTNNSYGGLSDEKLKENIVDASSQWNDIKALKVRKYSMKEDNLDAPNMLGVIAQEVEAAGMGGLVNEAVDKDADNNDLGTVTKQVNYSILYMKAVKALQEAMDRIETLEADVAALKNP